MVLPAAAVVVVDAISADRRHNTPMRPTERGLSLDTEPVISSKSSNRCWRTGLTRLAGQHEIDDDLLFHCWPPRRHHVLAGAEVAWPLIGACHIRPLRETAKHKKNRSVCRCFAQFHQPRGEALVGADLDSPATRTSLAPRGHRGTNDAPTSSSSLYGNHRPACLMTTRRDGPCK